MKSFAKFSGLIIAILILNSNIALAGKSEVVDLNPGLAGTEITFLDLETFEIIRMSGQPTIPGLQVGCIVDLFVPTPFQVKRFGMVTEITSVLSCPGQR